MYFILDLKLSIPHFWKKMNSLNGKRNYRLKNILTCTKNNEFWTRVHAANRHCALSRHIGKLRELNFFFAMLNSHSERLFRSIVSHYLQHFISYENILHSIFYKFFIKVSFHSLPLKFPLPIRGTQNHFFLNFWTFFLIFLHGYTKNNQSSKSSNEIILSSFPLSPSLSILGLKPLKLFNF